MSFRHSSFVIRHSNFRGHSRGAFTLLELILALGLSVIIATVLTSAVYTAYHSKRSINTALDIVRAGEPSEILAQELTSALPPTPPPASAVSNVTGLGPSAIQPDYNLVINSFYGDAQSVSFSTSGTEPKADIRTDVRFVEYLLVTGDDGTQSLVRRVTTNILQSTTTDDPPPGEPVCTKVLAFTLSYYDGTSWYDTWDSTAQNNALPLAVQYTLELAPRATATNPNPQSRIIERIVPLACAQPTDPNAVPTTGGTP